MAVVRKKRRGLGIFGRPDNHADALVINAHQVGTVRSAKPVYVSSDGTVVGDIFAPQVTIAGLVYGFVIGQLVVVEAGGEVWGDIYSKRFKVEAGGQVNGWMSSIDDDVYKALMDNDTSLHQFQHERNHMKPEALPKELQAAVHESLSSFPPDRVNILRQLQYQAALAAAARLELERSFDERLQELTERTAEEAEHLGEEVQRLDSEREELLRHIAKLRDHAETKDQEAQERTKTINEVQRKIEQQADELETLQASYEVKHQETLHLQKQINQLEGALQKNALARDEDANRMRNLEVASQTSLERASELEEALQRWQELAEVTERQAQELKSELNTLKIQTSDNASLLEKEKSKRLSLENELDKAHSELYKLQKQVEEQEISALQNSELTARVQELEENLDRKTKDLNLTKQALVESTAALAQAKRQADAYEQELLPAREKVAAFEVARAQIETLKAELNTANQYLNKVQRQNHDLEIDAQRQIVSYQMQLKEAQTVSDQAQERLIWHVNSLRTVQEKLDSAQERIRYQDERLLEMQAKLAEQKTLLEKLRKQPNSDEVAALKAQIATLKADQEVQQTQLKQWQEEIQNGRQQIAAFENEINMYEQNVREQGQKLAELQAELVERELYIKRVMQAASKQAAELKHVKKMATNHINGLEQQLTQAKQQLKDLSAVLARRQKRDGGTG